MKKEITLESDRCGYIADRHLELDQAFCNVNYTPGSRREKCYDEAREARSERESSCRHA